MTYCAKCGIMNPDDLVFCQKCGTRLQSAQDAAQPQSAQGAHTVNNYYYGRLRHRDRKRLGRQGQGIAPPILAEKEVIKEIVLLPCAYCGSLMPQTSTVCPHCGARRKV